MRRSDVFPAREEQGKLVADLLRHGDGLDLDLIASDGITSLAGNVLHEDDLDIPTQQSSDDTTNVLLSPLARLKDHISEFVINQ